MRGGHPDSVPRGTSLAWALAGGLGLVGGNSQAITTRLRIWCATPQRRPLTDLTEYYSSTRGPQEHSRTESTRFWDVSSTDGPRGNGRTISGGLRIWGFESLAARNVIAGQPACLRYPTLVLIIFGPI
jgi:hypothetical protein